MNNNDIVTSWNHILELTKNFKQLTGNNSWLEASELATLRHKSITQHFATFPVGPETAEFYFKNLSDFMKTEETLQKEATTARKEAMKAGASINKNKTAIKAYTKSS